MVFRITVTAEIRFVRKDYSGVKIHAERAAEGDVQRIFAPAEPCEGLRACLLVRRGGKG